MYNHVVRMYIHEDFAPQDWTTHGLVITVRIGRSLVHVHTKQTTMDNLVVSLSTPGGPKIQLYLNNATLETYMTLCNKVYIIIGGTGAS